MIVRSTISKLLVSACLSLFGLVSFGTVSCLSQTQQEFHPHATACDYLGAPPGTTVTIAGTGFSTRPGDMAVTFGGVPAQIRFVRDRSIECVIPNMAYPAWNVPIVVKTFGVASPDNLTINVQERPICNKTFPR